MDQLNQNIIDQVKSCRSYNSLFNIPFNTFYNNPKETKDLDENFFNWPVKLLILTSTCNGFGDIVTAMKIKKFIFNWYGNRIHLKIATNNVAGFVQLGEKYEDLIHLKTKDKNFQCQRFNTMIPYNAKEFFVNEMLVDENIENFDLYFIVPLTADNYPDFKEIHSLVKNSNRFNTFFFTEYNMPIDKNIRFNIGVGENRLGLLLEEKPDKIETIIKLQNPYTIIYVAQYYTYEGLKEDSNLGWLEYCYLGFLELVTSIYKLPILEVVCPLWMEKDIKKFLDDFMKYINIWYKTVIFETPEKIDEMENPNSVKGRGKLIFRFDVLPLQYEKMKALMNYSLPHVLLTGDQSFTDFIALRADDGIPFYQGLPWKTNLYKNLARAIPNKYYKSYKTSCGDYTAIRYNTQLKKLVQNESFAKKGKPIMDAVIKAAAFRSKLYKDFKKIALSSKDLETIKRRLTNLKNEN
jgi:hypothetical protein